MLEANSPDPSTSQVSPLVRIRRGTHPVLLLSFFSAELLHMLERDNNSGELPVLTSRADLSVPVFARFCGDSYDQSSALAQLGSSSARTQVAAHISNESIHQYRQHFGHPFRHRASFS